MSEMVERIARSIHQYRARESVYENMSQTIKNRYLGEARAVIEAMRDPLDNMIAAAIARDESGNSELSDYIACSHEEAWRTMIDEALK